MGYISSRIRQKYIKRNYCRAVGGCLKRLPESLIIVAAHYIQENIQSQREELLKWSQKGAQQQPSLPRVRLRAELQCVQWAGTVLSNKSRQRRKLTHVHMLNPCKGQTDWTTSLGGANKLRCVLRLKEGKRGMNGCALFLLNSGEMLSFKERSNKDPGWRCWWCEKGTWNRTGRQVKVQRECQKCQRCLMKGRLVTRWMNGWIKGTSWEPGQSQKGLNWRKTAFEAGLKGSIWDLAPWHMPSDGLK